MKNKIKHGFLGILGAIIIFLYAFLLTGAYDGNGTFNRVHNWVSDKAASIAITASRMDAEDDGFAAGLTNAITKDGQTVITADIPFATNKITGLGVGTANTDSLTLGQAQNGGFLYAGTGGGTADVITLTMNPVVTAYVAGQKFRFLALGSNTTTVTVDVNSIGAVALKKRGGSALVANDIPAAGAVIEIVHDGTDFEYSNGGIDLLSPGAIGTTTPAAGNFTTIGITTQGTGDFTSIGATTAGTLKGTTIEGTTSLKLATGATVTGIIDEDSMATNSATLISTQQSIKAYVDNNLFPVASQAEQETGTSLLVGVTPGRQQYHQSAAKAWLKYDQGSDTINASYNITSVVDGGTGDHDVTIATDFSSSGYVVASITTSVGGGRGTVMVETQTAGVAGFQSFRTFTDVDADTINYHVFFGDQ